MISIAAGGKSTVNAIAVGMHEIATTATLEIFIVSSIYLNAEKRYGNGVKEIAFDDFEAGLPPLAIKTVTSFQRFCS